MIILVIGSLILLSGLQTVELINLKNRIETELTGLTVSKSVISTSSTNQLQQNLQNLPSMVGGC